MGRARWMGGIKRLWPWRKAMESVTVRNKRLKEYYPQPGMVCVREADKTQKDRNGGRRHCSCHRPSDDFWPRGNNLLLFKLAFIKHEVILNHSNLCLHLGHSLRVENENGSGNWTSKEAAAISTPANTQVSSHCFLESSWLSIFCLFLFGWVLFWLFQFADS